MIAMLLTGFAAGIAAGAAAAALLLARIEARRRQRAARCTFGDEPRTPLENRIFEDYES